MAIRQAGDPRRNRMFYAKMNDDDDELPRYEEEDEGLEHPHDGEVIEEGEETIVEIGVGEEEPETPSQAPSRRPAPPARKKAKKAAPKKKKAKPKQSQSEAQGKRRLEPRSARRRARSERSADAHRLADLAILRWEPETPAPVVVF